MIICPYLLKHKHASNDHVVIAVFLNETKYEDIILIIDRNNIQKTKNKQIFYK